VVASASAVAASAADVATAVADAGGIAVADGVVDVVAVAVTGFGGDRSWKCRDIVPVEAYCI
jgi:hypothetical protein